MYRKVFLLSLLFIILFISGCSQVNNTSGKVNNQNDALQIKQIKCIINIEKDRFFKGEPILVNIKIKNKSNNKLDLSLVPTFQLGNLWAPVNIKDGKSLSANSKINFTIYKGKSFATKIDITKLGWDQTGSSIWPNQNLYRVLSPGKLKLFLDVYINNNNYSLRSNQVEINFLSLQKP